MSSLIKNAEKRLHKAEDASRDPADFTASRIEVISASRNAGQSVSSIASSHESDHDSNLDIAPELTTESEPDSSPASSQDRRPAGKTASGRASKAKKKARRRVGRPAGPERTMLSIRVLAQIDERLTTAVEQTGRSPQYIVDEALDEWLTSRGL